jgi:hypothetical protein
MTMMARSSRKSPWPRPDGLSGTTERQVHASCIATQPAKLRDVEQTEAEVTVAVDELSPVTIARSDTE